MNAGNLSDDIDIRPEKKSWLVKMEISKIKMTKSFLGKRSTDIAMKI